MSRVAWLRSPWFWIAWTSFVLGYFSSRPYGGVTWAAHAIGFFLFIGGAFFVVRLCWRLLWRGAKAIDRRTGAGEP